MKTLQIVAACSLVAVLAGCGSSGTATTPTASVSGSVADGYLVNATVFLDRDRDFVLDADEPSAITDGAGKYTLTVAPADIGKYPVVALATAGTTIDLDTNTTVADSYLLCMPAASMVTTESGLSGTVDSNFISPISTLVQERMAADPALTLVQAVEQVRLELGLPVGTNPLRNYIAGNHTALHAMAQEMVALMMEQRAQIMNPNGSGVDSLKYRSMVQTMSQNMQQLYQNAAAEPAVRDAFRQTMRDRIQAGFVR